MGLSSVVVEITVKTGIDYKLLINIINYKRLGLTGEDHTCEKSTVENHFSEGVELHVVILQCPVREVIIINFIAKTIYM